MSYDQPDKAAGFAPSDHPEWVNQLMLIWPISVENVVFTRANGTPDPTDVVTADVAIITLPDPKTGQPTFIRNARIGGKALTPQIKNKCGKKVLGKFVQLPRQGEKSGAFCLDVPASDSPEWAQMVNMAEQYEAQFPRVSEAYAAPASSNGNGAAAWQQTATASPPATQAPAAASWQSQGAPSQPPAQSWGGSATTQQPPAQPSAPPWPEGLREFLESRQINTQGMDEGTARQIAATISSQQ